MHWKSSEWFTTVLKVQKLWQCRLSKHKGICATGGWGRQAANQSSTSRAEAALTLLDRFCLFCPFLKQLSQEFVLLQPGALSHWQPARKAPAAPCSLVRWGQLVSAHTRSQGHGQHPVREGTWKKHNITLISWNLKYNPAAGLSCGQI